MYQVRVLGNFPKQGVNTVISLHEVEMAQRRDLAKDVKRLIPAQPEDAVVVCDVARFGDDETVIGTRFGPRVRIVESYNGRDLMQTVGHILTAWRALRDESKCEPRIVVDDDGLGGGVVDRIRELAGQPGNPRYEVTRFQGGAQAIESDEYPNARSEAWFRMAGRLSELDLDSDEQLAADLTSPTYKLDSNGRRVVEPKAETKKRLGRSPDRGDMALMALVPTLTVTQPDEQHDVPASSPEGLGDFEASRPRSGSLTADLLDDHM
jgi:hypothetical protein